jgi:hypothetical protein
MDRHRLYGYIDNRSVGERGFAETRALSMVVLEGIHVRQSKRPTMQDRGPLGGLYVVTPKSCAYADAYPRMSNKRDRPNSNANATWRNYSPASATCPWNLCIFVCVHARNLRARRGVRVAITKEHTEGQ